MKTCTDTLSPVETLMRDALARVVDPEIGENIVELGLVYGIAAADELASVRLTMTSPACPLADMVLEEAYGELNKALPQDMDIDLQLVWEPPWHPSMMSDAAKQRLGWS